MLIIEHHIPPFNGVQIEHELAELFAFTDSIRTSYKKQPFDHSKEWIWFDHNHQQLGISAPGSPFRSLQLFNRLMVAARWGVGEAIITSDSEQNTTAQMYQIVIGKEQFFLAIEKSEKSRELQQENV